MTKKQATSAKTAPKKLIGSDATSVFAGRYDEEYLHELRGKQAVETYDEMRRSDGQIKMLLRAVKNPLKAATYKHEPKDASDKAKEVAEFLDWHWLENPFFNLPKTMNEFLTFLDFGYSLHEYGYSTYQHRQHGLVTIVGAMGFRKQKSIEEWIIEGSKGLTGVRQYAYGDTVDPGKESVVIPVESLCILVNDQEGENYEGESLLRSCYGSWFRKKHLLKMLMIGAEKAAIGTPVGTYPTGAQDQQRKDFETILNQFTAHEANYLMAPQGFTIDVKQIPFDAEKLMAGIVYEDGQMAKSMLMAFLELGQNGNGGAYSLGEDQSDLALSSLQYIGDQIASKMRKINEKLVEWNFGDPDLTPRTLCSGINKKAAVKLLGTLQTMVGSNIIRVDDTLEVFTRDTLNLPKAEMTRKEAAEQAKLNPPAPGTDPEDDPEDPKSEGDPPEDDPKQKGEKEDDDLPPPRKIRKFGEPGEWAPWRELTVYEQPLQLAEMVVENQTAADKIGVVMRTQVSSTAAFIVKELRQRLARRAAGTTAMKIADRIGAALQTDEYERSLLRAMADAVATGSKQAKRELEAKSGKGVQFAESLSSKLEFLPPHVQEGLKQQAKKQAEAHAAELKKILDMTVISSNDAGVPDSGVVANVEDRLNEYLGGPKIESAADIVASQSVARGRDGFFFDERNLEQIQAFQYSAIIDGGTTPICLALDGKIFRKDDPNIDRFRPPNHMKCRSTLVPITLNEPKPEITGLHVDPTNQSLKREYERRGKPLPDLETVLKSRNL